MRGTLIGDSAATRKPAAPGRLDAHFLTPLAALGGLLVLVSAFDLGFAWFPLNLGNEEWEFGTISRTFDGLALGTVGLGFLMVAGTAQRSRAVLAGLAAVFTVSVIVLLAMVALYALNAPVALGAAPARAQSVLERAVARTSVFMVLYVGFYVWSTWFVWRRLKSIGKGASE